MPDAPPPELRFLKILVGGLAVVMAGGIITLVALVALRLPAPAPPLPDAITLPDGLSAEAVTLGRDFIAVVVEGEILIFDRADGGLRQRVALD
ncbi:DUF6476 family protein [Rhodobaculum claviforme]|uniref:Uncharacterized protein n=1 Tax=Rhodobaculum claviforme TaxID=1549854 RepID=A0A934TNL0_9RHOB|nr:DUF6476 family protein [Rhodobaculum claviforme]MBK5928851.1 hypothetical protein [Rhodobaculum claviforme]